MKSYKTTWHAIYDCKYHLVWITKYRYSVLKWDVWPRLREIIRETAKKYDMHIYSGAVNRDHIHLLISIPPYLSVSKAVQYLKWGSSYKLQREFPSLKKQYRWQHLWARWYWVASSGNVTDEVWKEYIDNQKPEEPDDDFRVL